MQILENNRKAALSSRLNLIDFILYKREAIDYGLFTVPINKGMLSVVMAKIKGLSRMKSMISSGGSGLMSPGHSMYDAAVTPSSSI